MSTEQEILVTGIKVVDLLAPYAKGGKIGMFHWLLTVIMTTEITTDLGQSSQPHLGKHELKKGTYIFVTVVVMVCLRSLLLLLSLVSSRQNICD